MNEAKVPDSDTDWRNVDIFIFSNGQTQTPPRKYHLGAEELARWSSTLMNLAHAQYGAIFSSIDLYTIDGQVILTPMQISNGASYVAVPRQDNFIPSGYNEYLLKATRSREKRQNKYINNGQVEQRQDNIDTIIQATIIEAKEEVENVETLNEETNNVATSTIKDQINTISKVQPQHPARTNSTLKQTAKITYNNNHSTILRKQNSLISPPMNRKTSLKLKDNPLRKNLKVNTLKGPNNGSIINNTNNQFKINTRTLTKNEKNTDKPSTERNSNDHQKLENKTEPQETTMERQVSIIGKVMSSTVRTVTTDNTVTENTVFENVIDDNELIVVKKHESENRSMLNADLEKSGTLLSPKQARLSSVVPILMPIEEFGLNKEESPVTGFNNLIGNVYKPDADFIKDITSENKSKVEIDNNIEQLQEDKVKLINHPPVDSFIAVIEKGDVVDLNLKIQVRKCEGVISTQDSKPNNSITQKASQVNIDQEIVETIDKRSNLQNKVTIDEENTKVVVIQCSCCENHNLCEILQKIDTGTVKLNDKKYVILLPDDPPCNESVERNLSTQNTITEKEKVLIYPRASSLVNPVKKVFASTSIQRLMPSKITQDVGTTMSDFDTRDANTQNKPEVVENEEINCNVNSIEKIYHADSSILSKHKPSAQTTFVDSSTQTEWYTVLMEARRHEDGRYSFYLPPLHVLKYYGL